MKLYFPKTLNQLDQFEQYFPDEVEITHEDDLRYMTDFDHITSCFFDGRRLTEKFKETDLFYADIDNTLETPCSLDRFQDEFSQYHYYIVTSKSHQKPKISQTHDFPPADRFHVYFPLDAPITNVDVYRNLISASHRKYTFFDPQPKDVSRILYGNPREDKIVIFHDGDSIFDHFLGLWMEEDHTPPKPIKMDCPSSVMMKVLQFAADKGEFEGYHEWLKLGIALKAGGYAVQDWKQLSTWSEDIKYLEKKWNSFKREDGITQRHLYTIKDKYIDDMVRSIQNI